MDAHPWQSIREPTAALLWPVQPATRNPQPTTRSLQPAAHHPQPAARSPRDTKACLLTSDAQHVWPWHPSGPAATLFEKQYYSLMKTALREGGILCSQGECMWLHLDIIKSMLAFCRELFPTVDYAYTTIPTYVIPSLAVLTGTLSAPFVAFAAGNMRETYTGQPLWTPAWHHSCLGCRYPSGQIGFVLCSKSEATNFKVPLRAPADNFAGDNDLQYYNAGEESWPRHAW